MRYLHFITFQAIAVALSASACFYDPDRSKIPDEDASADAASTDTQDTSTETGTGTEDGGAAASEWPWSGIGVVCKSADDCDGYDADFCLTNPLSPSDPGRCTLTSCDTKGCPEFYQCCDCTTVGYGIMCLPASYLEENPLIGSYCQC